jgi:hypothetical protein
MSPHVQIKKGATMPEGTLLSALFDLPAAGQELKWRVITAAEKKANLFKATTTTRREAKARRSECNDRPPPPFLFASQCGHGSNRAIDSLLRNDGTLSVSAVHWRVPDSRRTVLRAIRIAASVCNRVKRRWGPVQRWDEGNPGRTSR